MEVSHITQNVKWEGVILAGEDFFFEKKYGFHYKYNSFSFSLDIQERQERKASFIRFCSLFDQKHSVFRDLSGKYVKSGCTTALDVVPWKTDGESVLREACQTRASFHDLFTAFFIYCS
ncbi:hypothetical protein Tco_0891662 [Tanacetum coccineum]|uniref:Uncharacterized protein n=1 Tax=Tanacetum coccineum TaxID=301880 RepID=A0ABQ5C3V9_9ASTR